MRRGDLVTVAAPGDYGKPRPAVVVQSDLVNDVLDSTIVCPLTSLRIDAPLFRIDVAPAPGNGLDRPSQIMVDKIQAVRRTRIGRHLGRLDERALLRLERSLLLILGIAR